MKQARSARAWAAIAACARQDGAPVALRHVVIACAEGLTASAGLSLARNGGLLEPAVASSPAAEELEELQFTLGQGPGMDAVADRGPVLVPDLAGLDALRRWPTFAPAAADRGIRGMFAFPVAAGAALLGVLDVYRVPAGPLPPEQATDGLVFADASLVLMLDARGGITGSLDGLAAAAVSARRAQVHQAAGMAAAQLGIPVADALAVLRARAYAQGRPLADLAADVLARRVSLAEARAGNGRSGGATNRSPGDHGADGAAGGGVRDDGHYSPDPGQAPGGRHGEEQ